MRTRFVAVSTAAVLGFLVWHPAPAASESDVSDGAVGDADVGATTPADRWNSPEMEALIRQGVRHDADGDFEAASRVWEQLGDAAPHHPAANVHAADTLIWLQIFDDETRFDEAIIRESEEGVRKAEAWVQQRPEDARARLYLGQALMNLGRLHGVRLRIFRAGRYGEKARKELHRALELDPTLTDAKYSLGLYSYYASLVPDLVQWFSFLWFIPRADAPLGLQYLGEVRQAGELYQFTAAFYLTNIRTYHEKWLDPVFALETLERLHHHHPRNSLLHFELLEALMLADRHEDVIREALALESHPGKGSHDRGRANLARIWRARAQMQQGRFDRAWELLERFGEDGPDEPTWGTRWVSLTRGQIKDSMGERDQAIAHYERITALGLNPTFACSAEIAAKGLEEPFRPFRRTSQLSGDPPDPASSN